MDQEGFYLPGIESRYVTWSSVRCIRGFKKDLITSDEVFLSFENDTAPKYVEVSEEEPGFVEFRIFIEKRFSFPEGWWEVVLKPAFSRNETLLYVRNDSAQLCAAGCAPRKAWRIWPGENPCMERANHPPLPSVAPLTERCLR